MFSEENKRRYSRQMILPEVGEEGQEKLAKARVLIVGAGGLGSPVSMYLAAAGVGTIGIVDMDTVDLSNLQRQILHSTKDLNRPKVESAKETLTAINPNVTIKTYQQRLDEANVAQIIARYDIMVNAVDNFTARFLMNDACVIAKKPLVEAGIRHWEGIVMTILPGQGPCYRCVFPQPPPASAVAGDSQAGVMGTVAGTMGIIQATEVIKLILQVGKNLSSRLLTFDALETKFQEIKVKRNKECEACGNILPEGSK